MRFDKKLRNIMKSSIYEVLSPLGTWKFWKELVIMTLGMLVTAAAIYYFQVPGKLVVGTLSGLCIVVVDLLAAVGITVSLPMVLLLSNIVLLVLSYFMVNKEFGAKTVYASLLLGPLTGLLDKVAPWEKFAVMSPTTGTMSVMGDTWFDLCCFVLLLSAAQAILFSINASTGGLDILAKIMSDRLHLDIGTSVAIAGGVICCTGFAINPFRMVVIGLICTWINGIVVDYFTAGINKRKRVCIVPDRIEDSELVRQFIINDLVRGCSIYEVTGGYTGEKKHEVQTLLTQDEFSDLMAFLKRNEVKAFITAGNVSEIYGTWFKHHKMTEITTGVDATNQTKTL